MTVRPDYDGGSLLNLMATLERGLGGDSDYAPSVLPVSTVASARRVVLLLVDGLGDAYLQRHAPALAAHRLCSLTSVFPSATAPAVTTVLTGAAPTRHAVTGWFMHVPELDRVMTFLPFRPRLGGPVDATPGPLVGAGPFNDRIEADSVVVSPKEIVDSAVSRALCGRAERRPHGDMASCMGQIRAAVREPGGPRYIYAYWSRLDGLSHRHGPHSAPAVAHLRELAGHIERLAAELAGSGTLLLVTADHGFSDVTGLCRLADHPELAACLAQPLCGEPRAAFCYLRPGAEARFRQYVGAHLADRFDLYEPERLVREGWLGPGPVDPRLGQRLGDLVLLGREGQVLVDAVPGEAPWRCAGVHGGASEPEMRVPLLALDC